MTSLPKALRIIGMIAALGVALYVLYVQVGPLLVPPCKEPIPYSIANLDTRFGLSEAEFADALLDAETLLEEAVGKDLFVRSPSGGISVQLKYSEEQRTTELGAVIDSEQAAYDAQKAELETLKASYNQAKDRYESEVIEYDELSAEYHQQVNYWNDQGGAPPDEYERIQRMRERLEDWQRTLKALAADANDLADSINASVDELNRIARTLNSKVDTYNDRAGDEFDQGDYQEDATGKYITVYEFSDGTDLRRVLAHEFGHALGIGHVENPSSIMYSYNAGSMLALTEEDIAALRTACRLD